MYIFGFILSFLLELLFYDNINEHIIAIDNADNVFIYELFNNELFEYKFVFINVVNEPPILKIGHEKYEMITPINMNV